MRPAAPPDGPDGLERPHAQPRVSRNIAGALFNETDTAVSFPGSTSTSTVQGATPYWGPGPQTFSLEAWVKHHDDRAARSSGSVTAAPAAAAPTATTATST